MRKSVSKMTIVCGFVTTPVHVTVISSIVGMTRLRAYSLASGSVGLL